MRKLDKRKEKEVVDKIIAPGTRRRGFSKLSAALDVEGTRYDPHLENLRLRVCTDGLLLLAGMGGVIKQTSKTASSAPTK
ncbi:hypothetical protein HYQ44_012459 [Verticillium longisporum]|nr:hypothetical protein HYQ44_012459 [Verticillium longisporum]